jgi:di/tripeptidase
VKVSAEGGHSWYDFGNSNAVTIAAEIIGHIYSIQVPANPRTTYNIGVFKGGRSINSIAEDAEFTMDMRSMDPGVLKALEEDFIDTVEETAKPYTLAGSRTEITLLAERPGGSTPRNSRIVRKVLEAREMAGLKNEFYPSSTDANIPISMGIPSVTFGIYRGEGAHTVNERIEIASLDDGMRGLLYSLVNLTSPNGLI